MTTNFLGAGRNSVPPPSEYGAPPTVYVSSQLPQPTEAQYSQLPTSSSSSSPSSFIGSKQDNAPQSPYPQNFQSHGYGLMAGVQATNPYALWIAGLSEFFGVMVWVLGTTLIYGLSANPIAGALGVFGLTAGLYFVFGMWMRPHLSSESIILSFMKKQCGWPLLFAVLFAVFAASFAGAGVGRWILTHQEYDQNVAFRIKLTASSKTNDFFKGMIVELIFGAVGLATSSWLRDANMDMAVSGLILGFVNGASQLAAFYVTGAAFYVERFLAINAIAADPQFWGIGALAFILAWAAKIVLVYLMQMIYTWLLAQAEKWGRENPSPKSE